MYDLFSESIDFNASRMKCDEPSGKYGKRSATPRRTHGNINSANDDYSAHSIYVESKNRFFATHIRRAARQFRQFRVGTHDMDQCEMIQFSTEAAIVQLSDLMKCVAAAYASVRCCCDRRERWVKNVVQCDSDNCLFEWRGQVFGGKETVF